MPRNEASNDFMIRKESISPYLVKASISLVLFLALLLLAKL